MTSRNFPDKAIDLIDDAASKVRNIFDMGAWSAANTEIDTNSDDTSATAPTAPTVPSTVDVDPSVADIANPDLSNNDTIPTITDKDIAEVVSFYTGIPVMSMLEKDEKEALLHMESYLAQSIIGQEEAISSIANCIRRSQAGLRFHDRPLGVFLLLGTSGVGKTELAKVTTLSCCCCCCSSSSSSSSLFPSILPPSPRPSYPLYTTGSE